MTRVVEARKINIDAEGGANWLQPLDLQIRFFLIEIDD